MLDTGGARLERFRFERSSSKEPIELALSRFDASRAGRIVRIRFTALASFGTVETEALTAADEVLATWRHDVTPTGLVLPLENASPRMDVRPDELELLTPPDAARLRVRHHGVERVVEVDGDAIVVGP